MSYSLDNIKSRISGGLVAVSLLLSSCTGAPGSASGVTASDATASDVTVSDVTVSDDPRPETASETTSAAATEATDAPETEAPSPEPVAYEDISPSVVAANADKNSVQGRFTDPSRSAFRIENLSSEIVCGLKNGKTVSVSPRGGDVSAVIDSYIKTSDDRTFFSSNSMSAGRMNSYRIGYYYADFRIHDQEFLSDEPLPESDGAEPFDHLVSAGKNWGRNDVGKLTYSDHVLTYIVDSSYDPYIYSECDVSCDDYTAVHIVIRAEKASGGQFFLAAGGIPGFTPQQSVSFNIDAGEWTDITVPINVMPDYDGRITAFRVDVGAAAGEKVEISTLEFVSSGPSMASVKLERVLHTYPDKTHEHMRIVAVTSSDDITEYGETMTIPADAAEAVYVDDGSGLREWKEGEVLSGVYAAAAVTKDGTVGYIIPDMYLPGEIRVEKSGGDIVITHYVARSGRLAQGLTQSLAHRIYVSGSRELSDLAEAVRVERSPLEVKAVSGDSAGERGYDPYSGQYIVTLGGSEFNKAYYDEPDKEYSVTFDVIGDGRPRKLYIEAYAPNGCLECGALLGSDGKLLPIPVEVSKNFCGEYEEPLYDPDDDQYGETRFVMMSGGGIQRLTVLNLYQNWGASPLRQLSSIQFHIPYYHLSYGATETNCIAPYFVYGKDGWTLPDFRAQSAPLWDSQPQHTSVGRLYLPYYTAKDGGTVRSELQTSVIDSAGPVYPDVTMKYLFDDGRITGSYRHLEMPWSDENRTMYSFRLDVTDDVEIANFARDFRLFEFDGRGLTFTRLGYLGEGGSEEVKELSRRGTSPVGADVIKLGADCPYFDYYLVSPERDTVNFGLIVKSSDIVIGGESFGGRFVLLDGYDGANTVGSLSLDIGQVTLKKGDHIYIDLILLPWGTTDTPDDTSVRTVRRDTCLDPYRIGAEKGEIIPDPWLPRIKSDGGEAVFTVSGGSCGIESGNALAVRVYGFEKPDRISVLFNGETAHITDGEYQDMQVYLDDDGTYSFAFVVMPELIKGGEVRVECVQK